MGPIHAFSTGVRRALAAWPVLLMLFLATLLVAVPLALFPASSLLEAARRPVIEDMTGGFKTWQIIDGLRLIFKGMPVADQPAINDVLVMKNGVYLVLLTALVPLLGGFVSAFFWGGALVTYRDLAKEEIPGLDLGSIAQAGAAVSGGNSPAATFRMGRFLWGCWRWFGSFLLLAVIQAGLLLAAYLPVIALLIAASSLGTAGVLLGLVLLLLLAGLWMAVFELARVQCVVLDTRNPFTGIGRALRLIFRHMPSLIGFYGLALLALLLVHLAFRVGLVPRIPTGVILVTLLAQQAFILARLLALGLRLAGLAAIAQSYQDESARRAPAAQEAPPFEERSSEAPL